MKSTSKFLPWIGAVLLAVAGLLPAVRAIQGGYDAGTWPGVMLGLATSFAVITAIATRNAIRLSAVARLNPSGFTSNVVAYRELPQQLQAVGNLLGVPQNKVRSPSCVSVSVDSDFLRIYGGAGNPQELVALPISNLVDIQMRKRPQGKWNLICVELVFGLLTEREPVDLCLLRSRWGLPRIANSPMVENAVAQLISIVPACAGKDFHP